MRRTLIGGIAVCALLAPAAPAVAASDPILTSGMEHPAVKRVQKLLGVSPQTGFFGPVTLAAVKTYQRAHGIPTTGVVGPLQAVEGIKLITGTGAPLVGRLLLYDGLAPRFDTIRYGAAKAAEVA